MHSVWMAPHLRGGGSQGQTSAVLLVRSEAWIGSALRRRHFCHYTDAAEIAHERHSEVERCKVALARREHGDNVSPPLRVLRRATEDNWHEAAIRQLVASASEIVKFALGRKLAWKKKSWKWQKLKTSLFVFIFWESEPCQVLCWHKTHAHTHAHTDWFTHTHTPFLFCFHCPLQASGHHDSAAAASSWTEPSDSRRRVAQVPAERRSEPLLLGLDPLWCLCSYSRISPPHAKLRYGVISLSSRLISIFWSRGKKKNKVLWSLSLCSPLQCFQTHLIKSSSTPLCSFDPTGSVETHLLHTHTLCLIVPRLSAREIHLHCFPTDVNLIWTCSEPGSASQLRLSADR